MRLLLATGHTLLDETLKKYLKSTDIQVVGECYSRIVLNKVAKELQADTVIISGLIEDDDIDLIDSVIFLRRDGIRVIVLPGSPEMEETKELIINLVPYGVYDYVYDEVSAEDIFYRLKNPATLNDVPQELVKAAIEKQQVGEEINKKIKIKLSPQNRENKSNNKQSIITVSRNTQVQGALILATGDEDINEAISTSVSSCETVTVYSRYELIEKITEINPTAVILSPNLPGELDILEIAFQVSQVTDKVLFISGQIPDTDITVARIKEFGIQVLSGDINIGTILKAICALMGNQIKECTYDSNNEEELSEKTLFKIAKVGSELSKNLPSIHVPKIPFKKKKINYEKVIAVASPVPAGKTFVAVNLAVTLAQMGYRVCLVDGEILQQSTHTWLNGMPDEQGLKDALESDEPLMHAAQLQMVPNLYILNRDPFIAATINLKSFTKMLNLIDSSDDVDVVVVDTYRNIAEPLTKTIIEMASAVILVADQDFSHLMKLQTDLDKQENSLDFNKCFLLVNRVVDSQNLEISDAEKAAGLQADGIIPEKTLEVLESIKTGIPAALFCPEIREVFEEFWNRREQYMYISHEVS